MSYIFDRLKNLRCIKQLVVIFQNRRAAVNTNINGAKEEGKKYRLAENEKFALDKIDNVFMVMFPVLFSVFNIVYWTVLVFYRPC